MTVYLNGVAVAVAPAAHEGSHVSGGADDIDSALAAATLPALTDGRVWEGDGSNRPAEADAPAAGLTEHLLYPMLTENSPSTVDLNVAGRKKAHSIRPSEDVDITRIGLLLGTLAGNPGTLSCEIWSDSGGDPDSVIANGGGSIVQGSILDEEINWVTYGTPPSLTAGTLYWIVLFSATQAGGNTYNFYTFTGKPTWGKGIWGLGTMGAQYQSAWSGTNPPIDIILGKKS